jgi:hypothetical protein
MGFCMLTGSAFGSTVTFVTQPGASDSDGALSAMATFTTSANSLTIQLSNQIANIVSDGQALNALEWGFDDSKTATSIKSSLGDLVMVNSDGTYTDKGAMSLIWKLDASGLELCVLCVGSKPRELILGSPNSDNKYDIANSSILQHNPNIDSSATWILNVPGLTASNKVTSATFFFSTQEGVGRTGMEGAPEPASVALMGLGLIGIGGTVEWRRRRQKTIVRATMPLCQL